MAYESKYTGAEVDALLDKVNEGEAITVDSSLSTTSENPVQNKVITEELNKKATETALSDLSAEVESLQTQLDSNGVLIEGLQENKANTTDYYPQMSVGFADDLVGRGESVPAEFSFRASGGKSIKDGRAWIKRLKGNSVVWNNQSENSLSQNSPSQSLPIGSKLVQGHKYLMLAESITNCALFLYYNIDGSNVRKRFDNTYSFFTSDASISANGLVSGQGALWWYVLVQDSTVEYSANNVRLIDLTQMFGAGYEPTTIEEFYARKPIVEDEYAYNEGEVIHMTAEGIKSVGDNAWDEEWEIGEIDYNSGVDVAVTSKCRNRGFVKVLPNEEYYLSSPSFGELSSAVVICYDENKQFMNHIGGGSANARFTIPSDCHYIRFTWVGTTYNNDIMITLVHSGWKQDTDAGYQPYWQDTLPLPIIRKYFPEGMKKAGTAHDEIRYNKASGKWEAVQRIGKVDMGTLNWGLAPQMYFRANLPSDSIIPTSVNYNGFLCAKYERVNFNLIYGQNVTTPCFGVPANNGVIGVYDSSYTDAASFKAAMQGVILYYELAEPTIIEYDEPFNLDYRVADFGTEQAIAEQPSAPISADIIYQFNAVDMIREHELEITELQNVIATMQAQLASLTSNNG